MNPGSFINGIPASLIKHKFKPLLMSKIIFS
ncbi:hypothetical protein CP01DC11_1112, partial [Chlamydia psittaci 01DC11]